jgi:HK97 family phage major capsid protein
MTPEELKQQLIDEQSKAIKAFQDANDEKIKGKIGETELKATEAKIDAKLAEIGKAIAALSGPKPAAPEAKASESKLFWNGFRKKLLGQALDEMETKTMTVGDPTTGGFAAPVEFVNEMIKIDVLYSPIRQLARVRASNRRAVQFLKKASSASASWVTEIGTRAETTNPKIALEELPVHEMYAMAYVSKHDLEDTDFDLEGFLREEFGEQFGVLEGTAFVSGNSVGKPEGILTNASVTGFTGVTTSGKILADDLNSVLYSLAERYVPGSTWIWRRASTLAIALLKNGTTGDYMWKPGLGGGYPATVLGRPYVECPDMPAEANTAKAVAIGDFKKGYFIVDRVDMEILVDPYTSKKTGCIEISARKRVGGQVVLPEAIKVYTLKS